MGVGEVSDIEKRHGQNEVQFENCASINGKGISSSKIIAANLVKHIRGQHKLLADQILRGIEFQSPHRILQMLNLFLPVSSAVEIFFFCW